MPTRVVLRRNGQTLGLRRNSQNYELAIIGSTGNTNTPSGFYPGARITGGYEQTNRQAASGDDAPYSADPTKAKPTPWDTFEGVNGAPLPAPMGGKRLSYVQFGLGVGWSAPTTAVPGGNPTTTANFASVYNNLTNWAYARGAFCQFDWGTTAQGISDILADNATARTVAGGLMDAMLTNGKPVLFRPLWEPNGNWYVWGTGGTGIITDAQYIQIWRTLYGYAEDRANGFAAGSGLGKGKGTKNIAFFYCPNYWINTPGSVPTGMNRFPGEDVCHWVGIDGYARANSAATPDSLFGYSIRELETKTTKPIAIGEWGVMDSVGGNGKAWFFNEMFRAGGFIEQHPRLKAANYFHQGGNDGNDVFIATVEANRVAYANSMARPVIVGNVAGNFVAGQSLPQPGVANVEIINPSVLWQDNFDGTGILNGRTVTYTATDGGAPNPSWWYVLNSLDNWADESPTNTANVFLSGGNLVLRVKFGPTQNNRNGVAKQWSGAFCGTFNYPTGAWGSKTVKLDWPTPVRMECRVKLAPWSKSWQGAFWPMTTNREQAQGIWEYDVMEMASTLTTGRAYQHFWVNGADAQSWSGAQAAISDASLNWHTARLDIIPAGPKYYIDDVLNQKSGVPAPPLNDPNGTLVTNSRTGILFENTLDPGAAAPIAPASSTTTLDLLVDWVRVTALW